MTDKVTQLKASLQYDMALWMAAEESRKARILLEPYPKARAALRKIDAAWRREWGAAHRSLMAKEIPYVVAHERQAVASLTVTAAIADLLRTYAGITGEAPEKARGAA